MKKITILLSALAFIFLISNEASAQSKKGGGGSSYTNAVGLRVDFGTGSAGVGPNIKHFFNSHDAIDAALLFYDGAIAIGGEYQYHLPISGVSGLNGYFGIGPQIGFTTLKNVDTQVAVALTPVAGLDFKVPGAPLDLAFDWRPSFLLTPDTNFTAARFGLSARFTF